MNKPRNPIAVMYHYVRESRETSPQGIRPLFVDEFESQLDWIESNFRIVSAKEFIFTKELNSASDNKPSCLLTFDDGTRDHYDVVLPILKRRSLSAVFFVLTWPTEIRRMPVPHALHWALSLPNEHVWNKLVTFAKTQLGGIEALGSQDEARRIYSYETELRGLIKYAVNFAFTHETAEAAIGELVAEQGVSFNDLVDEWFLSEEQIRELHSSGMEIGMHGSSHRSLTQIGSLGIEDEIKHSSTYLTHLLGETPSWFCCPFTGSDANQDVSGIHRTCKSVGVAGIVTQKPDFLHHDTDVYAIPRFDCIALPPRSSFSFATGQNNPRRK